MFVKLCGIRRVTEVQVARELAVAAVGINLVSSSRRAVAPDLAFTLADSAKELGVFFVIDAHPPTQLADLLRSAPHTRVQRTDAAWAWPDFVAVTQRVEVVRLTATAGVPAHFADQLLISDTAGALGGTGQRADWALTAALARQRRVILAGGLTPENVAEAIRTVRPFGVDVAGGIEENEQISEARMRAFVAAARGA